MPPRAGAVDSDAVQRAANRLRLALEVRGELLRRHPAAFERLADQRGEPVVRVMAPARVLRLADVVRLSDDTVEVRGLAVARRIAPRPAALDHPVREQLAEGDEHSR